MASRKLDDLDPEVLPKACELIARLAEEGIAVMIVTTLRSVEEQKEKVALGLSLTMNSRHLPQPPSWKSRAIDLCPYDQYLLHGPDKLKWDTSDPVWWKIGEIAERLGFRWGGRFKQPSPEKIGFDPGHCEMV